jgi:serine/threonine protein kinase
MATDVAGSNAGDFDDFDDTVAPLAIYTVVEASPIEDAMRPFFTASDFIQVLEVLDVPFVDRKGFKNQLFDVVIGEGQFSTVKYDEISTEAEATKARINVAAKELNDSKLDEGTAQCMKDIPTEAITQAFIEVCAMKHPLLSPHPRLSPHPPVSQHPNILRLLGVTDTATNIQPSCSSTLSLITEFSDLGTIESFLLRHPQEISWKVKAELLCDVASGLQALHSCDIVHNDIKCANVLLFSPSTPDGRIVAKISDFGCSILLASEREVRRVAATQTFAPPEACSDECLVTPKRDIYSFGLVVLQTIIEKCPFSSDYNEWSHIKENTPRMVEYVSGCLHDTPSPPHVQSIVSDMLHAEPDRRVSDLAQVIRILRSDHELSLDVPHIPGSFRYLSHPIIQ